MAPAASSTVLLGELRCEGDRLGLADCTSSLVALE
jgi:hypothetical protein